MALSSAEKELVNGWADRLDVVGSWVTGNRASLVGTLVSEMRDLASGTKAADLKKTSDPTEGAGG